MPSSRSGTKILAIGLGVGAVALFGGALAFEINARGTFDDATKEPDDAKQHSLWQSANRKRYIAQGMAIGGIACAGAAVWLFVRSRDGSETATARRAVSVEPMLAIGGGGVMLRASC